MMDWYAFGSDERASEDLCILRALGGSKRGGNSRRRGGRAVLGYAERSFCTRGWGYEYPLLAPSYSVPTDGFLACEMDGRGEYTFVGVVAG